MPHSPNIDGTTVRTLADWGAYFKSNGQPHDVIELVNMENTILDDILWKEATDYDGHRTALRLSIPSVFWRRLYKGIDVSKSSVSIVKDPVGMLEARSIIDAKLLALHQSQAKAYRLSEAKAFMEAMRQELATAIFYGNIKNNPDGIHGLDPRYAFKDAPNVVDAGGTGLNCTSIHGIIWGENECMGIFPKDSLAGLQHRDLGESDVLDGEGRAFRAVSDLYEWNVGFSVRDWRCAVRICNIDTTKLMLKKSETGFIDLHRLTIIAKNKIPSEKLGRLRWYVNSDVMTALELQASDNNGNVTLVYRAEDAPKGGPMFKSRTVTELHGCPVRRCDVILNTEEALGASA
ncbi:hypothetical protein FACS189460_5880 [Deltaproteobacteria bacterium]|nr:hypothetical protein FACS189460_5880 [Deltaproteobacteria bacterium]